MRYDCDSLQPLRQTPEEHARTVRALWDARFPEAVQIAEQVGRRPHI